MIYHNKNNRHDSNISISSKLNMSSLCQTFSRDQTLDLCSIYYFLFKLAAVLASQCPLHTETRDHLGSVCWKLQAFSQETCTEETKDFRSSLNRGLVAPTFDSLLPNVFTTPGRTYGGVPQGSIPGPGRS